MLEHADYIPIIGYAGTVLLVVWVSAWRLSGLKAIMDQRIDSLDKIAIERDSNLRREMVQSIDEAMRSIGESLSAIRQMRTDDQLWGRDNFVRRSDFQNVVESFTRSIEALRAEMTSGYLRLDGKLDRILRVEEEK